MSDGQVFPVPAAWAARAQMDANAYEAEVERVETDPQGFWSHVAKRFVDTGQTFCGLMMGDHSKAGINTMFNTGTVVGVGANIFGAGFPRTFIPSFSWGGAAGFETFKLPKANEVAERVMARRNLPYDAVEQGIMKNVFDATAEDRIWDKAKG